MKRTIVVLFLGFMLLTGCASKERKYEKILQTYAKNYYDKYMSGVDNQSEAEVTLEMLKKANEYNSDFDLSKLEECDDATTVTLTLNEKKQVIDYNFELKCN